MRKQSHIIEGNYVDILNKKIFAARLHITNRRIATIETIDELAPNAGYILPGFVDSHVHIESSMLIPSEFARMAVVHGTVATVSDPHEIANVCGMQGVEFMINNGNSVPFKFYFGAPSCVPATIFETAGATISAAEVETLLQKDEVKYLSEMMNFPGVLNKDPEVMLKLSAAQKYNKPIDGHAPGLRGDAARQYANAGISTDHECTTKDEADEKLQLGMKILIREGSAAKNFDALIDLLHHYENAIMFCSDDKHPDSLIDGHINKLCARAVARNIDVFKVLKAACINPVLHYKLNVGLLRENDAADFIIVDDLTTFAVRQTWIDGTLVAEGGKSKIERSAASPINHFNIAACFAEQFEVKAPAHTKEITVIEALDGQLITNRLLVSTQQLIDNNGSLVSNIKSDILKIAVINRYTPAKISIGWIKNFGLKHGAIASSVAHDSHNIIVVGATDGAMVQAANAIIKAQGGISCAANGNTQVLPLPVAGLMSTDDGYKVANDYTAIDMAAKELGSQLSAPFMTLSFMALLVIPSVKISDKGMFDGNTFTFINE